MFTEHFLVMHYRPGMHAWNQSTMVTLFPHGPQALALDLEFALRPCIGKLRRHWDRMALVPALSRKMTPVVSR